MEKNLNNFVNLFSILPAEIQQHIATYLDGPALGFFAQSSKQALKNVLPLLHQLGASFPLRLAASDTSTYLYQANQLLVCGDNTFGQLGLGDNVNRLTFIAVQWPAEQSPIKQIIAGGNHTAVLTDDYRLWVSGANDSGQLGLGHKMKCTTFTEVEWPAERGRIEQVITGTRYTIVLTDANRLWGCGDNRTGQLGLGDRAERSTFTPVTVLPPAMQQVFTLKHTLKQLITLGTALMQNSDRVSDNFSSQCQPDEPESQPPLKAMQL